MVVRGQGVVVAELAELELLVAAVAEVAERSHAVSRAEVPMEYWVRDEKMGVDCNTKPVALLLVWPQKAWQVTWGQ